MTYGVEKHSADDTGWQITQYGKPVAGLDRLDIKLQADLVAVALNLATSLDVEEYGGESVLEYLKAHLDRAWADYLITQHENGNL